jgi:hypothetical protein
LEREGIAPLPVHRAAYRLIAGVGALLHDIGSKLQYQPNDVKHALSFPVRAVTPGPFFAGRPATWTARLMRRSAQTKIERLTVAECNTAP